MSNREEYDDRSFFEKYGIGIAIGVVLLLLLGVGVGFHVFNGKIPPPKKPQEIMVHITPLPLPPPPPPPPPPKVPPPPKEQKMVELKPQDKAPPKPVANDKPAAAPGPKASGPPSDDGIGGGGGGGGGDLGGGGGTVFGFYAGQVGEQVKEALARNGKTNKASFRNVKARVSVDGTGRIAKATLKGSTGDPTLDAAIRDALTGLQLREAPPTGMPPSILLDVSEIRPTTN